MFNSKHISICVLPWSSHHQLQYLLPRRTGPTRQQVLQLMMTSFTMSLMVLHTFSVGLSNSSDAHDWLHKNGCVKPKCMPDGETTKWRCPMEKQLKSLFFVLYYLRRTCSFAKFAMHCLNVQSKMSINELFSYFKHHRLQVFRRICWKLGI